MRLKQASVRNFRLLKDVQLNLDPSTTVIVGRNNSGKTSFGEAIRRMTGREKPALSLQDFSVSERNRFLEAARFAATGASEQSVRELLPVISVDLIIDYSDSPSAFGGLAPLIIDLDTNTTEAHVRMRYTLSQGETGHFFLGLNPDGDPDTFFSIIDERIKKHYVRQTAAVDATNQASSIAVAHQELDRALLVTNVRAQRGLDDITTSEAGVLGRVLEQLFHAAEGPGGQTVREEISGELKQALGSIHAKIDTTFNTHLQALAPAFKLFGFPGVAGTLLRTESKLEFSQVLSNYTRVLYPQTDGPPLNESYNGLGTRNLLHILLQVIAAFREWNNSEQRPETHLVFIEEPEAFLHPQVQEVFIRQLRNLQSHLQDETDTIWPVQFVVTTHSPHIANEVDFQAIRYFRDSHAEGTGRFAEIKDLALATEGIGDLDARFLHQYLTLTASNLLFADAAVLVEGTSERLLIPRIVRAGNTSSRAAYLCILEIGGAYAYKFIPLLEFLGLRSLIVTDIDAVRRNGNNRFEAALVSHGTRTSNATIKRWYDKAVSPAQLLALDDAQKAHRGLRIAYQIPERTGEACGRSFEEAFILANPQLFIPPYQQSGDAGLPTRNEEGVEATAPSGEVPLASQLERSSIPIETSEATNQCMIDEEQASMHAALLKKSDFAVRFAVDEAGWLAPRYLRDGLDWLLSLGAPPSDDQNIDAMAPYDGTGDQDGR